MLNRELFQIEGYCYLIILNEVVYEYFDNGQCNSFRKITIYAHFSANDY